MALVTQTLTGVQPALVGTEMLNAVVAWALVTQTQSAALALVTWMLNAVVALVTWIPNAVAVLVTVMLIAVVLLAIWRLNAVTAVVVVTWILNVVVSLVTLTSNAVVVLVTLMLDVLVAVVTSQVNIFAVAVMVGPASFPSETETFQHFYYFLRSSCAAEVMVLQPPSSLLPQSLLSLYHYLLAFAVVTGFWNVRIRNWIQKLTIRRMKIGFH